MINKNFSSRSRQANSFTFETDRYFIVFFISTQESGQSIIKCLAYCISIATIIINQDSNSHLSIGLVKHNRTVTNSSSIMSNKSVRGADTGTSENTVS